MLLYMSLNVQQYCVLTTGYGYQNKRIAWHDVLILSDELYMNGHACHKNTEMSLRKERAHAGNGLGQHMIASGR